MESLSVLDNLYGKDRRSSLVQGVSLSHDSYNSLSTHAHTTNFHHISMPQPVIKIIPKDRDWQDDRS